MPRFVVHVVSSEVDESARAALDRRYPEIDLVRIEQRPDGFEDWICDAPNPTHLERWLTEQGVTVVPNAPAIEPSSCGIDPR